MTKIKKNESFELSLEELETLVRQLEGGDKGLEESLALFEKGVTLAKTLAKQLEEAKHKVEILMKDGEGYKRKPLEPEEQGS